MCSMDVAGEQLLIYHGLKHVPPTPKKVHAYCREGRGHRLSQPDEHTGMASVIVRGSHNSSPSIQNHAHTCCRVTFRTGVETLMGQSLLEPVMTTERSEMMLALTSARDFCCL